VRYSARFTGSVVIYVGEWRGLTGTKRFEALLVDTFAREAEVSN
jgi:hypothetical protein